MNELPNLVLATRPAAGPQSAHQPAPERIRRYFDIYTQGRTPGVAKVATLHAVFPGGNDDRSVRVQHKPHRGHMRAAIGANRRQLSSVGGSESSIERTSSGVMA
jgi:hypothetical protein